MKIFKPKNFMGRGVASPEAGITPYDSQPMGYFYGTAVKNPVGKMRNGSVGYIPVSKKQLGTPPKQVV